MRSFEISLLALCSLGSSCTRRPEPPRVVVPADSPAAPDATRRIVQLDPEKVPHPAAIRGTVTMIGDAPPRVPIDMRSKPECLEALAGQNALAENLVVGPAGGLKEAFVYMKKGLGSYDFAAPTQPAVLEQRNCMDHPHVLSMRVGQELNVINQDPFPHHLDGKSSFNTTGLSPIQSLFPPFQKEAVPARLHCDIHSWEYTYACVLRHPYSSVTTADGAFEIRGLPAGTYTLTVWHESYPGLVKPDPAEIEVELKEDETATRDFQFAFVR
jgi:hypothetical protein